MDVRPAREIFRPFWSECKVSATGIGGQMLNEAAKLAAEKNAEYLCLFVVDIKGTRSELILKERIQAG